MTFVYRQQINYRSLGLKGHTTLILFKTNVSKPRIRAGSAGPGWTMVFESGKLGVRLF